MCSVCCIQLRLSVQVQYNMKDIHSSMPSFAMVCRKIIYIYVCCIVVYSCAHLYAHLFAGRFTRNILILLHTISGENGKCITSAQVYLPHNIIALYVSEDSVAFEIFLP